MKTQSFFTTDLKLSELICFQIKVQNENISTFPTSSSIGYCCSVSQIKFFLMKIKEKCSNQRTWNFFFFFFFFCGILVLVSWQAFISSLVMKLDFISQPSSKSTLPFAGLQHMQQCQVNFNSIFNFQFSSMLWSKWMVQENWSPQWGFEPTTSQSWVFCLNH